MPSNNAPHMVQPADNFGRLTVIGFSHQDSKWRRHYLCRCVCGTEKTVQGTLLKSGNTRSCGCLAKESRAKRLPNDAAVVNHIILQYKRHARDRGIEFLLSRDDVDAIVRLPCRYCGVVGGNLKRTKNLPEGFAHNGIDRVDSSKPYALRNVVPCCGACNMAKGARSASEFICWAKRISDHQSAMAAQWGGQVLAERIAA